MRDAMNHELNLQEGPGCYLRHARTALNLSRLDVARQLRLKQELIAALEEDDVSALPAPIYVVGYIRNYARLLRIPSEPLIEAYNNLQVAAPVIVADIVRSHDANRSRRLVRWVSIGLFILIVAGLVSWLQDQDFTWLGNQVTSQTALEQGGEKVEPATLPEAPVETLGLPPEQPQPGDLPAVEPLTPVPGETPPPQGKTEQLPVTVVASHVEPVTPKPAAEAAALPDRLSLSMTQDCWTEVTDARGRRLVYDLVRAGTGRDERGTAPFQVFLGNATGVSMKVNGRPYDFSEYVHGNLARFTIIIEDT